VERTAASLAQDILSVWSFAGEVQAVLAVWSVCLGGGCWLVAGVDPAEEEGVNGGSAGGAFAWREAEESGKEDAVVQACCQKD
jgi:hypothetical protein